MGNTRNLSKKIGDIKGTLHARIGMRKDRNGEDLTEAEEIKKRYKNAQKNYTKSLNEPDKHDRVVTHLEPDILECEIKWALGSIAMNKTSDGGAWWAAVCGVAQSRT